MTNAIELKEHHQTTDEHIETTEMVNPLDVEMGRFLGIHFGRDPPIPPLNYMKEVYSKTNRKLFLEEELLFAAHNKKADRNITYYMNMLIEDGCIKRVLEGGVIFYEFVHDDFDPGRVRRRLLEREDRLGPGTYVDWNEPGSYYREVQNKKY